MMTVHELINILKKISNQNLVVKVMVAEDKFENIEVVNNYNELILKSK